MCWTCWLQVLDRIAMQSSAREQNESRDADEEQYIFHSLRHHDSEIQPILNNQRCGNFFSPSALPPQLPPATLVTVLRTMSFALAMSTLSRQARATSPSECSLTLKTRPMAHRGDLLRGVN